MRSLLVVFVLMISGCSGYAQINQKTVNEFGLGLTMLTAFTDMGGGEGASAHSFSELIQASKRPGIVSYFKFNLSPRYSIKLNGTVGLIAGSDAGSRNENRQYSFSALIVEVSAIGMYYIFSEKEPFFYRSRVRNTGWSRNVYPSLYVQGGVGLCIYSLMPNDRLSKATLMGYEGGKTATPVFPIGLGSTLPIARDVRLFAETNYVITLTDYLDGYSNPKYSKSNDSYFNFTLGLVYQIGNEKTNWRKSRLYRR